MDVGGWIYALCCFICVNAFSTTLDASLPQGFKLQRKNSKMSRDFPEPKPPTKDFTRFDKLLRQIQSLKGNMSEELNEIPDDVDPKIINGREAAEAEFPWMVALHFSGRFICSAFLIAPTIVMTAAHCVEFENGVEPATSFYGIIGNLNRNGPDTRIDFSEVVAHPDYGTNGAEGDIALMRITEPVIFSDKIQIVCLPAAGREFEMDYAQAMGWGVTSNTNLESPETLRTTELYVQPRSVCRIFFAFMLITITDRHICASSHRDTGVCFGDSGGPLVYEDTQSGRPLAIGVASFVTALGCGRPFLPSVYTATAGYTDWILETVGSDSGMCLV